MPKQEFGAIWCYPGKRGTVWRIRYQDASGRRVLETLGKEPAWNRKRAQAELRRRLVDVERDHYQAPDRTTFEEFAQRWLDDYLPGRGLKLTTQDSYRQTIKNHLLPAFGRLPLATLEREPERIDHYISRKIQAGLSPKTVTNHLLCLQVMLKTAMRWRLIRHNPAHDCDRPRLHQPQVNILTPAEIARLQVAYQQLERDADPDEQPWWRLAAALTFVALGTAMRRGELLALRWRDIHLLDNHLYVRQALVKGRFTTPKSRAGNRRIELGPHTTKLLAQHWQTSSYTAEEDLVFHHPSLGTPLDPSKLSRDYMRPALVHAEITKPVRPFHDLRHTALTHEAAAGNPMTYIQLKAGHSQIAVTERYIHAAQVQFAGAAERAEHRLFGAAS